MISDDIIFHCIVLQTFPAISFHFYLILTKTKENVDVKTFDIFRIQIQLKIIYNWLVMTYDSW